MITAYHMMNLSIDWQSHQNDGHHLIKLDMFVWNL